jgi:hypothetical protein
MVRAAAYTFVPVVDAACPLYLFAVLAGLAWFSTMLLTVSLTTEIFGLRHVGALVGLVFLNH